MKRKKNRSRGRSSKAVEEEKGAEEEWWSKRKKMRSQKFMRKQSKRNIRMMTMM